MTTWGGVGYSDGQNNLGVTLKASDGLIDAFTYDPAGNLLTSSVCHGYSQYTAGTGTLVASYLYTLNTNPDSDPKVYYLASASQYPHAVPGTPGTAVTTNYDYTWYGSSAQVEEMKTTLPTVTSDQNGSGVRETEFSYYDSQGNLVWSVDANGRYTYNHYNSIDNKLDYTIQDVDSNTLAVPTSSFSLSGWPLQPASGANARTDYGYDAAGRLAKSRASPHSN